MLGCYKSIYSHLEGIDKNNPGTNEDEQGKVYSQAPKNALFMSDDPKHEHVDVMSQIASAAHPKALLTRSCNFVPHALADDLTLKLCKAEKNVQRQPPHGAGSVELLRNGDKGHIVLFKNIDQLGEVM